MNQNDQIQLNNMRNFWAANREALADLCPTHEINMNNENGDLLETFIFSNQEVAELVLDKLLIEFEN